MSKEEIKLPILEKFEYKNIPLDGNTLRDKYPEVKFKDEDISWYNYKSSKRYDHVFNQFIKQYEIEDLCVVAHFGQNKRHMYLFDVSVNPEEGRRENITLFAKKSLTLDHDGFELKYDGFESDFRMLDIRAKDIKNNFELYIPWGDIKLELEINPDKSIADDYISFFVDKLFEDLSDEDVIYKHPNGCQYYTEKHHIHKILDIRTDDKEEEKRRVSLKIKKYDVVEPFKKYNDSYAVKSMPKKSRQISFEQMKLEFKSICKHVINNKLKFAESIYNASDIEHLFKGQNIKFEVRNGDNNYTRDFIITEYVEKEKGEQYIDSCNIHKKDKRIGKYKSFKNVDQEVKDEIMSFLEEKFGDDLQLDLMDSDLDHFVGALNLETYEDEEYDGDYFIYNNSFDLGKYKAVIYSSRYIKDGCICDLTAGSIDIYKK